MNMSVKSDQIRNATEALASSPKGKGEEEAVVEGEIFSVILDETSSPVEQEIADVIPAEQDISEEDVVAAMLADDALALLLEDVPEDDSVEVASDELVDQVLAESAAMNIDISEIELDEEAPETDEAPEEEVDLVNLVNLAQAVEDVQPEQPSEIRIAVDQTTQEIPEIEAQAPKMDPVAQPLDDKPEEAAEKVQAPEANEDDDEIADVTVAEVEIPEAEETQPAIVEAKQNVDRKNIPEAASKKDDVNPIDAFDTVRSQPSQPMSESRGKENKEARNFNPVVDAAHAIDAELQKSPETRVSGREMDVVTAAHDMGAKVSSSKMGAAEVDPANHYQAADARPLNEDHFVDNIVRHCRLLTRPDGSSEMRLRLDPPELGSMTLRLTLKDDHLVAHVELDGDIRESVENLIPKIRESLAADGLTLDRVDIDSRRQPESQNSGNADSARDQGSREGREFSRAEEQPKEHRRRASIRTSEGVMDFTV